MPRLSSRGFAERDAKQAVVRDNGHYLTNVGTIGEVLSAQMAEKYFSIVKGLTVQPALDDGSKLCVLQLCNIDLRDRDIVHVDGIGLLPFVTPLVTFPVPRGFGSDDDAVRAAGFSTSCLRRQSSRLKNGEVCRLGSLSPHRVH